MVTGNACWSNEPGGFIQGWLLGSWTRSQGVCAHTPGGSGITFHMSEVLCARVWELVIARRRLKEAQSHCRKQRGRNP